MIHCEILDDITNSVLDRSGYDRDIIDMTRSSKRSCDLKTWITVLALQMDFTFEEIADFLDHTKPQLHYYLKRHGKRLEDTDYKLKWERIKEIEL